MVGQSLLRQGSAQDLAKSPLDPVANHGIADLLCHCNAKALAHSRIWICQKHESGASDPQAAIGREEIGTLGQNLDHWDADTTTGP